MARARQNADCWSIQRECGVLYSGHSSVIVSLSVNCSSRSTNKATGHNEQLIRIHERCSACVVVAQTSTLQTYIMKGRKLQGISTKAKEKIISTWMVTRK